MLNVRVDDDCVFRMSVHSMTKTEGFITSLFRKGAMSDSRAPRFTDTTRLECGSCKLQFQIPIGAPFEIVASTDLIDWSPTGVTDSVLSTNGTSELHEARIPLSNGEAARGFLRLQVTPSP